MIITFLYINNRKRNVTFRNDKAKILTSIIRFGFLHPVTVKIIPAVIKAGKSYSNIIQPETHKFLIGTMIFFPLESHFCFSVSFTKKPKRNMRLGFILVRVFLQDLPINTLAAGNFGCAEGAISQKSGSDSLPL